MLRNLGRPVPFRLLYQLQQLPGAIDEGIDPIPRLNSRRFRADSLTVKNAAGQKSKPEADLLDQAVTQLLKAVKLKLIEKQGRVDYDQLRKEGYSKRFLGRLENS